MVVPFDGLHSSLDGLDIRASPADGESAQPPQDPGEDRIFEKIHLGHDVEPVVHRQPQCHQDGIPVAGVVGAQQHTVAGQPVQPLHGGREEHVDQHPCDIVDNSEKGVEGFHSAAFPRTTVSSAARLSSKFSSVVSTTTASSARRRGAVSRWESSQSRCWISEST